MPTFNYNYASSGGQPGSGYANQATGSANLISFSNTDNDSNDNTAFLSAVAVNSTRRGLSRTFSSRAATFSTRSARRLKLHRLAFVPSHSARRVLL